MSVRHWWPGWMILAVGMLVAPAVASAQTPAQKKPRAAAQENHAGGRFELSGGVGWTGGWDLGSAPATLTGNGVPSGTPVTLFDTDTRVESGPRFDARLGWRLTRAVTIEAGLGVTRTHLQTEVRNDIEQAPPITASERLTEYAIEGGIVFQVSKLAFAGGRARPFVMGGGGYLRQAHEGSTRIDTGQIVYAGGGLTFALRQAGRKALIETLGLRGDARFNVRTGGFEIETGDPKSTRIGPSVGAGLFVRF